VAWVPPPDDDEATVPRVGYAIGRHCGNAVTRNRLRRRLRAVVADLAVTLPPGAYLVSGSPPATGLGHGDLVESVRRAMSTAAGRPA
jgi:ribonuclease P protein component